MSSRRILTASQAFEHLGQEVTWFDPLGHGPLLHTEVLIDISGCSVKLGGTWYRMAHIWIEPAAMFRDERFTPERPNAWSRLQSLLRSLIP